MNADQIILNPDPGPLSFFDANGNAGTSNISRLLISSAAGINAATTKYVCKTRTDIFFRNNNIVHHYRNLLKKYPNRMTDKTHFSERLIVHEQFSKNSRYFKSHLGYLSDILLYGSKTDLCSLFSTPPQINNFSQCFFHNEVYLWLPHLSIKTEQSLLDASKYYESFVGNNLFVCNSKDLGTTTPFDGRYPYSRCLTFSFSDWKPLYRIYCKGEKRLNSVFALKSFLKRLALEFFPIKLKARLEKIKSIVSKLSLAKS
ncbi:MAG: WavE lipopolysaccharide synthesis family protein [Chlamydiales bacterium]|nr:WavE lipopolysaccharide synthesis family protein [Chlamydiales bacterium]